MKKYLLLVMVSLSTVSYTQVNRIVTMMTPTDRHNLFLSTKEVADAYNSLGRTKKANSFYRSAISIYPIGDQAHQLANRFNMPLDDEKTYTNFVVFGDTKFENQQYKVALYSYLMADELDNSPVLYQKIATTYEALGYSENAAFYQELGKKADLENPTIDTIEPMTEETPTDYTDIDEPAYLEDENSVNTQTEDPISEENMVETEDTMTTEAVETEETMTPDTQNTEDMEATDEVMTLEADVDTEDTVSEEAVSETNTVNTDDLNNIMKVDYEEQLN